MRRIALALCCAAASLPVCAADVGVSIAISEPGVYGRIDIGRYPQPAVVVQQPVIVTRAVAAPPPPVYLWVPPGHRRHWSKHCHEYRACGAPVYFVRDDWYRGHVMRDAPGPGWQDHDRGPGRGNGHGRGRHGD